MKQKKGFTLIEILIVIGLIAVLAGVLVVALNPARQFAQARDAQRWNHIDTIISAVIANTTDNKGTFTCAAGVIPATATDMSAAGYNIAPCLVPTYAAQLPVDPSTGSWTDTSHYDTKYTIAKDSSGRVTVAATGEIDSGISITR